MQYFVYILFSVKHQRYYCGQTDSIQLRLERHNSGEVKSTKYGIPWSLVGLIKCSSRTESMLLEKQIKKRGIARWIIANQEKLELIA